MGTHMPYVIILCYLPPGRGDIPALATAEAGTWLSNRFLAAKLCVKPSNVFKMQERAQGPQSDFARHREN